MNRLVVFLFTISFFEINTAALVWIDENALKAGILKNPNDLKSRLIYARFLMERNETAQAESVLHENAKINAYSKELQKEITKRKAALAILKINESLPHKKSKTLFKKHYKKTDTLVQAKSETIDEKIKNAKQLYQLKPSAANVGRVVYLYSVLGQEKEKIDFLRAHCRKNPADHTSKILLARFLSWRGEYQEALYILFSVDIKNSMETKLLIGQILLAEGYFERAKPYLTDVARSGNNKQRFMAEKSRAFLFRWEGDTSQSRELFIKLHQQNPADKEIAEEVLIDQKKFAPLITLYEQKLYKEPHNPVLLEKISYFYQLDGQDDKALCYREKLYAQTKKIVLLRSMGDIALKMKQTDRGLAYWEEYAIKSDSSEGWLDYGKNLYWAGKYEQAQTILAKITDKPTVGAEAKKLISDIGNYLQEKERLAALPPLIDNKEAEEGKSVLAILPVEAEPMLSNKGVNVALIDHRLNDNAGLTVNYVNTRGIYKNFDGADITVEAGHYRFENATDSLEGFSGFVSAGSQTGEIGARIDTIANKTSIHPYLRIGDVWGVHSVNLIASRRNVGFVKNALTPLLQNNILTTVQLTDYALFPNNHELWASIDFARDQNDNTIVTPQFQYRFIEKELPTATWSVSAEGWYTTNTHPNETYYSPKKADVTYLSTKITVPLAGHVALDVMGGVGYSFESDVYLYKAGLWLSRPIQQGLNFRFGCSDHRSQSTQSGNIPYTYNLCDANLNYQW